MNFSDLKTDYYDSTGKLSDICRNSSFAGIGIVWILSQSSLENIFDNLTLKFVLMFFFLGLAFDLFQYVYKSIMLEYKIKKHELKFKGEDPIKKEVDYFRMSNYPTIIFFYLKIICTVLGYIFLVFGLF